MAVIDINNFSMAAVGFLLSKPCSCLCDDLVTLGACRWSRGVVVKGILRIAVEAATLDDGGIIHIAIVQIYVAADAIDRAFGRILPDAVFALIGTLAGILCYPVSVRRELRVVHALFEARNSGAVNADEVSGGFHCLAESNGGLRDTDLGRSRLCFIIHVDRVFKLFSLQDFQKALCISFSGGSGHAVLTDKIICADRNTGCFRTFVICFPLTIRIKTGIGAASFDDGKLDTGLFDLVPVNVSLPMGYVNSFIHHACVPPHCRGRGAALKPLSISQG